jgi:RimJ/RimL family protein N-acetyltransferase
MPQRAPPRTPHDPRRPQRLRLRDGRVLVLRPVDARDAGPIDGAFELLHEDEVRRRFLHPVKALSADHVQRLTNPGSRELVLVAAEPLPPGEALVGAVARIACDDDDPQRAEFAILVSHFVANQGLGRRMLARLVAWARQAGVREVFGDVLDDNDAMLALAAHAGFRREARHGAQGLTRVIRRLRPR